MNIGLTNNGQPFFVQDGVGCAGHNAKLALQGVPALNSSGVAVIFPQKALYCHSKPGYVFKLFFGYIDFHICLAAGNGSLHLVPVRNSPLNFPGQLRQGDGRQLHAEFFQQLTLVAHSAPKVKGPWPNLQNADIAESLHHIAHSQKILYAPGKHRVV